MKLIKTLQLTACGVAMALLAPLAQAQTTTTIHSFVGPYLRSSPYGGLVQSGTVFYGASWGGGVGTGIVFKINSNGSGKTTLHEFSAFNSAGTNSDGANPYASLLLSGTMLYGTASAGGTSGFGAVFKVNIDGSGFTTLHNFSGGSDGATPMGSLIVSNNTLYGTTSGTSDASQTDDGSSFGTVFKVGTTGTGFATVYTFTDLADGANPMGSLVLSSGTLYGTAFNGGYDELGFGFGTVFSVTTAGANFDTIFAFGGEADGANPAAGLVLSGTTLYGTASMTGQAEFNFNGGAAFSVNIDGSGFNTLHDFGSTENDGVNPYCTLVLSGSTLYGVTSSDGENNSGTVFAVNTAGTSYSIVYTFSALNTGTNSDGSFPYSGPIISGTTLYGMAVDGGSGENGTIYSVKTNGTGFTAIHDFEAGDGGEGPGLTPVIVSGTTLYGTTGGTVFSVHSDGTGFTTLHIFSQENPSNFTNEDGASPGGGLALSGTTLYGTAEEGGTGAAGTLFKMNVNGNGFTVLHTFSAIEPNPGYPLGPIAISGNTIYGTAASGGADSGGIVYSVSASGASFTTLYTFTHGSDSYEPAGVILSGSTLYGVTYAAGGGGGTVFKLNTNGAGFATLANVGFPPIGPLVLSGSTLYGVNMFGGGFTEGSVYSVSTSGSGGATTLCSFNGGSDGSDPNGGLVLSGTTLYGLAAEAGSGGHGTVYSIGVSGSAVTVLYNFTGFQGLTGKAFNSDGALCEDTLTLSGTTLYGVATYGGDFTYGTAFSLVP